MTAIASHCKNVHITLLTKAAIYKDSKKIGLFQNSFLFQSLPNPIAICCSFGLGRSEKLLRPVWLYRLCYSLFPDWLWPVSNTEFLVLSSLSSLSQHRLSRWTLPSCLIKLTDWANRRRLICKTFTHNVDTEYDEACKDSLNSRKTSIRTVKSMVSFWLTAFAH